MGVTTTTSPVEQARSIFNELGYTLSGEGTEFRAERKWRVVRVTATEDAEMPVSGTSEEYRCFVTAESNAMPLRQRLRQRDLDYEWAIIALSLNGDYEVLHSGTAG